MTDEEHPAWYELSSIELIQGQIDHLKFELSVAGAPLVIFSFGEAFLNGEMSSLLFYACGALSISLLINYILISQAHVFKKAYIFYEAHKHAREAIREQNIIHFGHLGLMILAKVGSIALTIGYLLLIWSLLFG